MICYIFLSLNIYFVSEDEGGDLIRGYSLRHGATFANLLLFYAILPDFVMYGCLDITTNLFRCCDAAGGIVSKFEKTFGTPWQLIRYVRGVVLDQAKPRGETFFNNVFVGDGISLAQLKERCKFLLSINFRFISCFG